MHPSDRSRSVSGRGLRLAALLPALLPAALLVGCARHPAPHAEAFGEVASPAAPSAGPLLVTPAWLAARASDPTVVVVHAGTDAGAYAQGHLPGARFLPMAAIAVERDRLPMELPPVAQLDSALERVGVADGATVVVYGDPLAAARTVFTLEYLGHPRARILDGGLAAWRAAGRPVSTAAPAAARASFTPRPRPEMVVQAPWVEARLRAPRIALLDARAPSEIAESGRIPGARAMDWRLMMERDQATYLPRERLAALFREHGIAPGDTVVAYCRTGVRASVAWMAARLLGHPVKLYDGSWVDWAARGLAAER